MAPTCLHVAVADVLEPPCLFPNKDAVLQTAKSVHGDKAIHSGPSGIMEFIVVNFQNN